MAKSSDKKAVNQPQFSLKHRLMGAGILISFGVLILPWLLGSYSAQEHTSQVSAEEDIEPSSIAKMATKAASKTVGGDTKTGNSEGSTDKKDVKVFVSRVQPLDKSGTKTTKPQASASVKKADKKPVKSDNKVVEKPKLVAKSVKKVEPKKNEKSTKKVIKKADVKKDVVPKVSANNVERGYIVSVGVFGDEKNVQKMVSDLKSKKFSPSVRKEKFNSKSVSRIFMGPFKTRAEAGKVKLRLSEQQNIPSLIKEFP